MPRPHIETDVEREKPRVSIAR